MKRSSEQDFDLFNEDFMVELWGNPKQVRLEGGDFEAAFLPLHWVLSDYLKVEAIHCAVLP